MSQEFAYSTLELMNYLSKKLLNKSKDLSTLLISLPNQTIDTNCLTSLIKEINTDLKQASFAIKALLSQINTLTSQVKDLKNSQSSLVKSPNIPPQNSISIKETPLEIPIKQDLTDYSSEIIFKLIQHPYIVEPTFKEFGNSFISTILKNKENFDYLKKINEFVEYNIKNYELNEKSNNNLPLRIKLANKVSFNLNNTHSYKNKNRKSMSRRKRRNNFNNDNLTLSNFSDSSKNFTQSYKV